MCGVIPAITHTSSRRLVNKHRDNFVFYLHSKCADSKWIYFWAYFPGSDHWGSCVCPGPAQQASDTTSDGGDDRPLELLSNTYQFIVIETCYAAT